MLGHPWVLIVLGAIALIIFGPRRLPELGEGVGKAIKEFRKATTDVTDSIKAETTHPAVPPVATGVTYTQAPQADIAAPGADISPSPYPPSAQPGYPQAPVTAPHAPAAPLGQPEPPPEAPRV
jgi:sec-independent protein translocase protein TatA